MLKAQEQTLQHETEMLKAQEQALKSETETLKAQEQALKSETEMLKAQEQTLQHETEMLKAQEQALKSETETLKAQEQALQHETEMLNNLLFTIESEKPTTQKKENFTLNSLLSSLDQNKIEDTTDSLLLDQNRIEYTTDSPLSSLGENRIGHAIINRRGFPVGSPVAVETAIDMSGWGGASPAFSLGQGRVRQLAGGSRRSVPSSFSLNSPVVDIKYKSILERLAGNEPLVCLIGQSGGPYPAAPQLVDETVTMQRRAFNRDALADAFREHVFELSEFDERAIVSKRAKVVEEVNLAKQAETRDKTVTETVRRSHVRAERVDADGKVSI
jgi:olfactory receptor